MTTLVLHPGQQSLDYAFVRLGSKSPIRRFRIRDCRGAGSTDDGVRRSLLRIQRSLQRVSPTNRKGPGTTLPGQAVPESIAVHVQFGGDAFDSPAVADAAAVARLESLVPAAPLHLPLVLATVRQCQQVFPAVPIALAFDTAFFVALPDRESHYALDGDAIGQPGLRRFGYHGLFHQAASADAAFRLRDERPLDQAQGGPPDDANARPLRILSICLEPRPEIAAVVSGRPIAVSGGVTPLEGLPGETTCGEMDPGIILDLARQKHWGPEQIDHVLTRRSGLFGLTGRRLSLARVLRSTGSQYRLARDVMRYRMMMLAGAALAAMGGLDAIVFSGRYAPLGRAIGPWLCGRLTFAGGLDGRGIQLYCCRESLDRMLADAAAALTEPALQAVEA